MNPSVDEYMRIAQKHFGMKVHLAVVSDGYRFQLNNLMTHTVPFNFNPSMYDELTEALTIKEIKKPVRKRQAKKK